MTDHFSPGRAATSADSPLPDIVGGGEILADYLRRTPASAAMAARARKVLPGGIVTDTRHFEPYGIYVDRAAGIEKWDLDGNRYLDFFGGHGANMLGHSHPALVRAAKRAIARGTQYAANQPLEVELAERVVSLLPSIELLRFTGSGTEATMLALRLARAFTGRPKILRLATLYHGWHDHAASGYMGQFDGAPGPGILPAIARETLLIRPGDREGLMRAVERHGSEIAAFIVEPLGSHFGVVPVAQDFIAELSALARETGALFIFDEVLSGFRVNLGGAQSVYGLRPDLTTFGKVLCGGLPGAAVGGRADIMALLDHDPRARAGRPKVLHQGTLTGNPVSMAAGLAMLTELERIDGCRVVNDLGTYARRALNDMCLTEGLPFRWYGEFSAFHLLLCEKDERHETEADLRALPVERFIDRPQPFLNRFRMALNVLGFDVNTKCSGLLSALHTTGSIDCFAEAVVEAGRRVKAEGLIS